MYAPFYYVVIKIRKIYIKHLCKIFVERPGGIKYGVIFPWRRTSSHISLDAPEQTILAVKYELESLIMYCDVTEIKCSLLTIMSWWYLSTIVSYDSLGTATPFVFSDNVIYLGKIFRRQLIWDMFVLETCFSSGHLLW